MTTMRSTVISALAAVALLGIGGCQPEPVAVTLEELADAQDVYDGQNVIAEGLVQTFDDPRHFWIEDPQQHRVELLPMSLVEDFVGQRLRVTGTFTFRDDEGRRIQISELHLLDP